MIQEGPAGNWTDQLEVPEETGAVARFDFGPDWAKTLEVRIDKLEPARRVEWTPVGGFPGWIGTSISWDLEASEDGRRSIRSRPSRARSARSSERRGEGGRPRQHPPRVREQPPGYLWVESLRRAGGEDGRRRVANR